MKRLEILLLALSLAMFVFFTSCGEDDSTDPDNNGDPDKTGLYISSVEPTTAYEGETVTIKGNDFGDDQGESYVRFKITKAKYSDYEKWTNKEIKVKVPEGARTGDLTVTVGDSTVSGGEFVVLLANIPSITEIEPSSAKQGDEIKIKGHNFGDSRDANYVEFNGARADENDYISWKDTEIKVKVPLNASSGKVFVNVGGKTSNQVDFTIESIFPTIISITPESISPEEELTINGKNFGDSRGSNYIEINHQEVPGNNFIAWSDTQIKLTVPKGATSGDVVAYIDGMASNSIEIEIVSTDPYIDDISPHTPSAGEEVSVYGRNFGDSRGGNYVEFNGLKPQENDYVSWEDDKIIVKFPFGASSGDLVVYIDGVASNAVSYNVYETILQLVLIPKGEFMMGSEDGMWSQPVHKVKITYDFYMSETEITQAQWKEVFGSVSDPSKHKGDNRPVEQINWFRAVKFCNEMSAIEGFTPCYTINGEDNAAQVICDFGADGYRLPTEAEWEYACRAGTAGEFGGTGNISTMGWTSDDFLNHTSEVAQKQPNDWGLYDMHGNVYEWCWDGFDSFFYEESPETDPVKNADNDIPETVIRGGSYLESPSKCSSAARQGRGPTNYEHNIGFRVVRKKM